MSDQQPPPFGDTGGSQPPPNAGFSAPQYGQPPAYSQVPPGYGPSGHPGFGAPAQSHGRATTSMVLGICALASFVVCGLLALVLGPLAFFFGRSAEKEIAAMPGSYSNPGQAKAGWIMGLIASILAILGTLLLIVYFVAFWNEFQSSGL